MDMTLWSFKYMDKLIVRLKAIKYKEDFFCYLSFYLDLSLQATYFQILFSRLYTFRSFFLGRMLSRFSIKHICPSFRSQIRFNNLNLVPYAKSLIDQILKAHMITISQLLSCYYIKLQLDQSNIREQYLFRPISYIFTTCIAVLKA